MRIDEDLLARALRDEAETVQLSGDGLMRIQERIATRRRRWRWLRPVVALGTAAAVVAGVLAGLSLTNGPGPGGQRIVVPPASHSPAPSPRTSGLVALWPTDTTTASWRSDAQQTAVRFAVFLFASTNEHFLALGHQGSADDQHVTVGYPSEGGRNSAAAVVHVVHRAHGWTVVGTDDTTFSLTTPRYGATASSPATVGGRITGVDESIHVQVRTPQSTAPLGDACCLAAGGTNSPWTTTVGYSGAGRSPLTIVAWTGGHLQPVERFTVTAVLPRGSSRVPAAYPSSFAAVSSTHVLRVYSTRDGRLLRTLATNAGGHVQVSDDRAWVYYDVTHSRCNVAVMRVPLAGGTPQPVVTGHDVLGFAVGRAGELLAYTEGVGCNTGRTRLVVENLATGQRHTVAFPPAPPVITGMPAWAPDGVHVAAVVRTGMASYVQVYDGFAATKWSDGTTVAPFPNALPVAVGYDAVGNLVYAVQAGSAVVVHQVAGGRDRALFRMPNGTASISVAHDGAVLGADLVASPTAVQAWRWAAGSAPVRLPTANIVAASW